MSSPSSIDSLGEDIQVGHKTVANWVGAVERLFEVFRIAPYRGPRIRAAKDDPFDGTLPPLPPRPFETPFASRLLPWVHLELETKGRDLELRDLRETDGREVDFVVTEARAATLHVEAKSSDGTIDRSLRYLEARAGGCPAPRISATATEDSETPEGIRAARARVFLGSLVGSSLGPPQGVKVR